jgi:ATP-dependent 26S proteasome regulatory subunit
MSTDDLEGEDIWGTSAAAPAAGEAGESKQADDDDEPPPEDEETRHMSVSELKQRIHLLSSDIRVMKSDIQRINHESRDQRERIRENQEKVKMNKQLPYLVANVVEVLEPDAEDGACICFFFLVIVIEKSTWESFLTIVLVAFFVCVAVLPNRPGGRRKGSG